MYSGTTFTQRSGRFIGVHQRIDRVSYRNNESLWKQHNAFPSCDQILRFEGQGGPDGIKRKSPGIDEPWHFVDPEKKGDWAIYTLIADNIYNMTAALNANDAIRASYEAGWMAHAITDALTPAHHVPLDKYIDGFRGGKHKERASVKEKLLMPGSNKRAKIRNNWQYWGRGGLMSTHIGFELGVASTVAPQNFRSATLTKDDLEMLTTDGFEKIFRRNVRTIYDLKMYEDYAKFGWTQHLAHVTNSKMMPIIIRTVALGWYEAIRHAEHMQKSGSKTRNETRY